MDFKIIEKDGYILFKVLNSRLDGLISPDLKSEFIIACDKSNNIVVDLSECSYCDSSGLSAMLTGNRLCERGKGKFILFGLTTNVTKLVKLAMLDTVLSIVPNEAQAISLLKESFKTEK